MTGGEPADDQRESEPDFGPDAESAPQEVGARTGVVGGEEDSLESHAVVVWHRLVGRAGEPADEASVAAWVRSVSSHFETAGGQIAAQLAGTVVGLFAAEDASALVELGLELLAESEAIRVPIALALALSTVREIDSVLLGAAFDHAQSLAARAHPGELIVETELRQLLAPHYLFHRQLGSGGVRGSAVDRTHPRRVLCHRSLARLGTAPLAPTTAELLPEMVRKLSVDHAFIVLRGPVGAGAVELVREAQLELRPGLFLEIGDSPAARVPLVSLRNALGRIPGGLDALFVGVERTDEVDAALLALEQVRDGHAVAKRDVVLALSLAFSIEDSPTWLFLSPLAAIDLATLEVIEEVRRAVPTVAVIARFPVDAKLPAPMAETPTLDVTLPLLRVADARILAHALLGPNTAPDVARRVAVLGGDVPLGVVEAARTMIAAGDVLFDGDRFIWRATPRGGTHAVPLEEFADERLALLTPSARRLLEVLCVAPDGATRDEFAAIMVDLALVDAPTDLESIDRDLALLRREAWLDSHGRAASWFVRRYVSQGLPPQQLAAIHLAVASAYQARPESTIGLRALVAHCWLEGGKDAAGAELALTSADEWLTLGYSHAAARLADAAARTSPEASRVAGDIVRRALDRSLEELVEDTSDAIVLPPAERMGEISAPIPIEDPDEELDVAKLRTLVRSRDVHGFERWIELAVASGSDLAAVARLRAVFDALRGDAAGAERRLARSRRVGGGTTRSMIADAIVALGMGDVESAVRSLLQALATAERAHDRTGRDVVLRTLASCYSSVGRSEDARRIASLATSA